MVVKCTVFEDNKGAKELAICPKNRPRTKHIAVKYHHFREHVKNNIIFVEYTPTNEQLADIMTKPLPLKTLEYLRQNIMGWTARLHNIGKSIKDTDKMAFISKVLNWN